jgi:PAS domain S-box-containing protein
MSSSPAARSELRHLHLQDLLDALPTAAYVCDAEGLIAHYNVHAVAMWGRAPKLNDPADRYCGSLKLFTTDGTPIAHDACGMAQALRQGREFSGREVVIERPDGGRIAVLGHVKPLRGADGAVVGAINVLVDVTERKRFERMQAHLAAIVETSDDAIISKTLTGEIRSWNHAAERLFGYTASEAVGQSITMLIPPDRLGEEDEILAQLRRGQRIDHYETIRRTKDGRLIDVMLTISPMRDAVGNLIGASKIARDITARKQAEQALLELKDALARQLVEVQDADRRKEEFLATLAHELRNPLAPIGNSLHILRLTGDLNPAAERIREVMERQFNHLVRLVDDLLEISRITRGKIELRKERVELAAVVRSAVEASTPLIEASGHQLALSLPPEPLTLEADPVRLAQVVANLLNNAAKYTERGGQIWLQVRRDGRDAVLSVKDTGVGIPPEMLGRVFDMFLQIDRQLGRSPGGLGIGLTLARNLVELHGGGIEAHSRGVGQGSEFVVRLPLATAESSDRGTSGSPAAESAVPRRILVVDDAQAAAFTLAKLLEKLGHETFAAGDADEALQLARRHRPDVVISDIGMPEIDGYQLAGMLRREPGLERTLLVALSGYGQESDRRRALDAGFDRHLVKPVSLQALRNLLAETAPAGSASRPTSLPTGK